MGPPVQVGDDRLNLDTQAYMGWVWASSPSNGGRLTKPSPCPLLSEVEEEVVGGVVRLAFLCVANLSALGCADNQDVRPFNKEAGFNHAGNQVEAVFQVSWAINPVEMHVYD